MIHVFRSGVPPSSRQPGANFHKPGGPRGSAGFPLSGCQSVEVVGVGALDFYADDIARAQRTAR